MEFAMKTIAENAQLVYNITIGLAILASLLEVFEQQEEERSYKKFLLVSIIGGLLLMQINVLGSVNNVVVNVFSYVLLYVVLRFFTQHSMRKLPYTWGILLVTGLYYFLNMKPIFVLLMIVIVMLFTVIDDSRRECD